MSEQILQYAAVTLLLLLLIISWRIYANRDKPLKLVITARRDPSADLFIFQLARPWWCRFIALPPFQGGQSVAVSIPGSDEMRYYSLARWKAKTRRYELAIKREPHGQFSPRLHGYAQPGKKLLIGQPQGEFTLLPYTPKNRAVFIAGGIGITPLLAMLDQWRQQHQPYQDAMLYWQVRYQQDAIYQDQLGYGPRILVSRPSHGQPQRISAELLQRELGSLADCDIYLCAGQGMINALLPQLQQAGVHNSAIHIEHFNLLASGRSDCTIHYQEHSFSCSGHGNLLNAVEAQGLRIDSGCRAGFCGQCLVNVDKGRVEHFITPEYHAPPGQALACCAIPKTEAWISQP